MTTLTIDSLLPAHAPRLRSRRGAEADPVACGVRRALAVAQLPFCGSERRREARQPFPYPVHLTPLSPDDRPELARSIVVIGREISPHGLDFYHRQPLPERRVIAALDIGDDLRLGLLLELHWCRFTRDGWYLNGGRFLDVVPVPEIISTGS